MNKTRNGTKTERRGRADGRGTRRRRNDWARRRAMSKRNGARGGKGRRMRRRQGWAADETENGTRNDDEPETNSGEQTKTVLFLRQGTTKRDDDGRGDNLLSGESRIGLILISERARFEMSGREDELRGAGCGSVCRCALSKRKRRVCVDNVSPVVVRLYRSVMLYI